MAALPLEGLIGGKEDKRPHRSNKRCTAVTTSLATSDEYELSNMTELIDPLMINWAIF